jgi:TetR/AcrR family transcriptional repressor of nem operon
MGRSSNREKIIGAGLAAIWANGFATSGVRDIIAAAGVPLGSFTNHFRSKEEFGTVVLARYFEMIRSIIARTLQDEDRPPIARLRSYFDTVTELLAEHDWRHGCLIGNMSLDSSESSDVIREQLAQIFTDWKRPFAVTVSAAQIAGEVRPDLDPDDLAEFLLAGWHGALLRMKVDRRRDSLDRFKRIVFATILTEPASIPRQKKVRR